MGGLPSCVTQNNIITTSLMTDGLVSLNSALILCHLASRWYIIVPHTIPQFVLSTVTRQNQHSGVFYANRSITVVFG